MDRLSNHKVDEIVKECLRIFNKLPKTGKPVEGKAKGNQWTVLSCIIKLNTVNCNIEVVALGTGTKCIGAVKMSPYLLSDSHAEVVARRAFLLYLYDNIQKAYRKEQSIFEIVDNNLKLNSLIEFCFFSSQMPCGDACIMPKICCNMSNVDINDTFGEILLIENPLKRHNHAKTNMLEKRSKLNHNLGESDDIKLKALCGIESDKILNSISEHETVIEEESSCSHNSLVTNKLFLQSSKKKVCDKCTENVNLRKRYSEKCVDEMCSSNSVEETDIYRTGAKCLPFSQQDPKQSGVNYHIIGQVRTKPGRGLKSLSVSCSDKLARWAKVGIQGALIDILLLEPIFVKHYIFGSKVPYSEETLRRAIFTRNHSSVELKIIPQFYQSSLNFSNIKTESAPNPSDASIIWANTCDSLKEVAVQGRRLGATKKDSPQKFCVSICRMALYKKFLSILSRNQNLKVSLVGDKKLTDVTLRDMKKYSSRYNKVWEVTKDEFFKKWVYKENANDFVVYQL